MARVIRIRKGLNLRLVGEARQSIEDVAIGGVYGIHPDDFYGFKPQILVHEGDHVLVGEPLFANKQKEELKVVSPVSGKVKSIVRGARRKVEMIEVEADGKQDSKLFKLKTDSREEALKLLLESGLFAFMRQRPYDIVPNPDDTPKGIFVSTFNLMPLEQDFSFIVKGQEEDFKQGVATLSRIAQVYVGVYEGKEEDGFAQELNAEVSVICGPNPAGNVGVLINHVAPMAKGEVAWTIGAEEVIFIGRLARTGRVNLSRTVPFAGSEVKEPRYLRLLVGNGLSEITKGLKEDETVRLIGGNPLVGKATTSEGYMPAHATSITAIPEGDKKDEAFGWIAPRLNDFSQSHSYFSWLQRGKAFNLDARIKGGERHIIMSGEYDRVFPMDIYANYLIKAILTADIDRMEQLGIYEVAPEDFAVAEFVDSSKLELQRIVREGIDMFRKEMS